MNYRRLTLLVLSFCASILTIKAQAPEKLNAAEIKQALNKLEVLGTVMYLAAHPDDENTRLIAYMANEQKLRTAYLAMTRGDGGQNLVGTEIRELLGIIRTQELLAARRTDGGEQFFTRANDFGYSKDPDETFEIWEGEDVLSDVVWNIRRFRPDVIITRFDTARVEGGRMHGHHTASAILAQRAFDIAADPSVFPEQLKYVEPWQPKGLYWNTYNFGGSFVSNHVDEPGYFVFDLNQYNPLLGKSYDEISALSRSKHKSQGFGSTGRRGLIPEFLMHWKGELPEIDIFENIDQTWGRVAGGKEIGTLIKKANDNFDMENPAASIKELLTIREKINGLEDEYWKQVKGQEVDRIIKASLGLYFELVADDYSAVNGESIHISGEAVNRSNAAVELETITFEGYESIMEPYKPLKNNENFDLVWDLDLNEPKISQPYWLEKEASLGMYRVDDQQLRGLPQNAPTIETTFNFKIEGEAVSFTTPIVYKTNDRVDGEVYRPFVVTPPVFVNTQQSVLIFPDNETKQIDVTVIAGTNDVSGQVSLNLPDGWKVSPASVDYAIANKGGEFRAEFQVLPPAGASEGFAKAQVTYEGQTYNKGLKVIDYGYIPTQTIFPDSQAKVVKLDLKKKGQYVGYIMGSGDAVPEALEQIGYQVTLLDPDNITAQSLANYDAVIVGVRAYNTIERMRVIQPELMEYVKGGGTMIAQYNTSMRNQPQIGPYPFSISRDRVTKEEAEVRILAPNHPLIDGPNKITAKDFEGWVQERGLYFPNEWDEKYTAILSANDPGETPKNGGLLVAEYGEGYFVYTGYSWFRELPAGVSGAFRIFANMISLGQDTPDSAALKIENNK
ncbi:PIG-L family deacetylase [Roseivirga pacifica]|uniref:PIG-L family deacetylase n=1 Tax=Roseivirga pacifica TaxID=1267423 RepID=UPI002094A4B5|nr:PIG-L family deacetylase [Roseivirga pacifica]MCO6360799.1 LmbE family protein [Roseivirga pacifica]MCO6368688.1 LmbE family protein [Roseivirga pacifica]MCO6372831.1 LmbE family protein [Roseivirga pacifica]MCO6376890.1 LmbE family protein [Roseivirga pacifica]MCO6377832.1 LmbE family protein [Roseivirga pacifica]